MHSLFLVGYWTVCNMLEIITKRRWRFIDIYRLISDLLFINYTSLGVASREVF